MALCSVDSEHLLSTKSQIEPCMDILTMHEGVNVDQVKSMQRVAIFLTRGRSYLASTWFSSQTLGDYEADGLRLRFGVKAGKVYVSCSLSSLKPERFM